MTDPVKETLKGAESCNSIKLNINQNGIRENFLSYRYSAVWVSFFPSAG